MLLKRRVRKGQAVQCDLNVPTALGERGLLKTYWNRTRIVLEILESYLFSIIPVLNTGTVLESQVNVQ